MKYKYTRYTGDELEGIDLEELVSKLSDLLLSSGFDDDDPRSPDPDHKMSRQDLHDAILEALLSGGLLSQETIEKLLGDPADADATSKIEQLIDDIVRKMQQQGYIMGRPDLDGERERREGQAGGDGPDGPPATFEATDKTIDFLGYRALRDLLGSLGKSSAGRHDTRDLSTGIEAEAAPKPYEFGDTMNLDSSATLLRAIERNGLRLNAAGGLDVEYEDLMVSQGEYQSSCATVLMLDCSHSMILYGEDRFTPAKRVALALAHLIKHQYPGDALHCVLFHDAAEEIPLSQLARVRVGPHYTNTRDGLRLARRILERQRKDMRQIIMINTFMLARDHDLVAFVRRVAAICRGKAYFTTPYTLGRYVLMDYMDRKTRTVH
jgi:Ca-activated chloride channel family protein